MVQLKKEKLISTAQGFLIFLDLAQKNKVLKSSETKKPHQEILRILEELSKGKQNPDLAVNGLNQQIKAINEQMYQLRYPSVVTRTAHDFLRNEVVAFELFLNMAMNAKMISFEKETELFNKAVALWEDIGHIKQSQSLVAFSNLVKQANALLPEKNHYPVPNPVDFPQLSPDEDLPAFAPHIERKKAAPPGAPR